MTKTQSISEKYIELFTQCLGGKPCRFAKSNHFHSIVIKGATPLTSKEIYIPDLRAGFAYVMAALIAKGESHIYGLEYLQRGYENIIQKLSMLGADIQVKRIARSEEKIKPGLYR